MENTKPDGGPVSAVYIPERRVGNGPIERDIVQVGMSLRDHFAGLAMQGDIAATAPGENIRIVDLVEWAYRVADAMIAERSK